MFWFVLSINKVSVNKVANEDERQRFISNSDKLRCILSIVEQRHSVAAKKSGINIIRPFIKN
jgi:hypothetical protein